MQYLKIQRIIIFIFLFNSFYSLSQESKEYKIYVDTNNNVIDIETFFKKCNNLAFYCHKTKKDSVEINKISKVFSFGHFNQTEHKQVTSLLKANFNQTLDNSRTLVISYSPSIKGYRFLKNQQNDFMKRDSSNRHYRRLTKPLVKSRQRSHDRKQKKCFKSSKKMIFRYFTLIKQIEVISFNLNILNGHRLMLI